MMRSGRLALGWSLGIAIGLVCSVPGGAAGFEVTVQGARAAGMAGAFAAQADDPTALFYNPGGLAFVEKKLSLGLAPSALARSQFQGQRPGFAAGTTAEQEKLRAFPAHAYAIKALS